MLPNNLFELVAYKQWIVRDANKVPINPSTLKHAAVNDASTWTDYQTAQAVCEANPHLGLGFVFTDADPFVGIDLDDPFKDSTPEQAQLAIASHQEMLQNFPSYAESSPSGKGIHILVRGHLPDAGGKNSQLKLEMYQSLRYFTITGNVIVDRPIADFNGSLTQAYVTKIRPAPVQQIFAPDGEQIEDDDAIVNRASAATNGELFDLLYNGNWNQRYESQSEADIALINIIAFYTENKNQAIRIFRKSGLGQRSKAQRDDYFLNPAWGIANKAFDRKLPSFQFSGLNFHSDQKKVGQSEVFSPSVSTFQDVASENHIQKTGSILPEIQNPVENWELSRGLLGDISLFIYRQAHLPCKEVALAGAIALLSGICGRQFNISETGLNQYIILLAPTGSGKEGAATGIGTLLSSLNIIVNRSEIIGPSLIPSAQGLIKHIAEHPCCVSLLGEVGYWLQGLTSKFVRPNELAIRRALLDLYAKSGKSGAVSSSSYSNKDDNHKAFQSPAFSIFGESTQQEFYKSLDESNITDGLIPRFTMIEYNGPLPSYNDSSIKPKPDDALVKRLSELCIATQAAARAHYVTDVQMTVEAQQSSLAYRSACRSSMESEDSESLKELYNRCHIKALKLAALIAVGASNTNPTITVDDMQWAINFIERGTRALLKRFKAGEVGETNLAAEQQKAMSRIVRQYADKCMKGLWSERELNILNLTLGATQEGMISNKYLQSSLKALACFRKDRDVNRAFDATLAQTINAGMLSKASNAQLIKHGKKGGWYVITDHT